MRNSIYTSRTQKQTFDDSCIIPLHPLPTPRADPDDPGGPQATGGPQALHLSVEPSRLDEGQSQSQSDRACFHRHDIAAPYVVVMGGGGRTNEGGLTCYRSNPPPLPKASARSAHSSEKLIPNKKVRSGGGKAFARAVHQSETRNSEIRNSESEVDFTYIPVVYVVSLFWPTIRSIRVIVTHDMMTEGRGLLLCA